MDLLRGWLFDNLGLKLTALLLALLVYLNVYTDRPAELLVSFPVEFTGLPDSLSLAGPAPGVVQAELKGTGKQLIALRVKEPRLSLSLEGVVPGRYERSLTPADLPLPEGAGISVGNLVGPRMISLDIDRRVHRRVPVAVRMVGTPAAGFAASGPALLDPPFVEVHGPKQAVSAMDTVWLSNLRLDGRRDTVRAELAPEGLADWVTIEPPTVRARAPVVRIAR